MKRFLVLLVEMYQKYLSPLKRYSSCRFYPTCSEYAILTLKKDGVVKGLVKTLWRILRCNPWNNSEYNDNP